MLEEASKDTASAESVRFERDEDQDGRGERMSSVLKVRVELGYQRTREIHGSRRRIWISVSKPIEAPIGRITAWNKSCK